MSRTVAQQLGRPVEKATAPFQCTLSTRAGCECIGHALQMLTDESNPNSTITSVDGISAYDTMSRGAMLSGLAEVAPSVLPFVRQFYGSCSRYVWEDDAGDNHTRSVRVRGANRETPSCLYCVLWGNTARWWRQVPGWWKESA